MDIGTPFKLEEGTRGHIVITDKKGNTICRVTSPHLSFNDRKRLAYMIIKGVELCKFVHEEVCALY